MLPIKHVAEFFDLAWDSVNAIDKAIDKAHLTEKVGPVDLRGAGVLAIDESAIRRGYRYATLVIDPRTKRVLWIGQGRKREEIRPFFERLGEEGRKRVKAVAMDMSVPFEEEVALNARVPKSFMTSSTSSPSTVVR